MPKPQTTEMPAVAELQPSIRIDAHDLELRVSHELMSDADVEVSSLVVRRIPEGVCLQGVLEIGDDPVAATRAALKVAGVTKVRNELLVHRKAR